MTTNLYNTTDLFQRVQAAEAAFALNNDLVVLHKLEDAERAYYDAVAAARAEWNVLPAGDRKDSAEQNAYDTEGCDVDELRWFEIAIMSFGL